MNYGQTNSCEAAKNAKNSKTNLPFFALSRLRVNQKGRT